MTSLVVDLDGTLLKSDLLYESFFDQATSGISFYHSSWRALLKGRAFFKDYLASLSDLDYARLPYDQVVLDFARAERARGRKVFLATASNIKHATAISAHLDTFDGVFASDSTNDLAGSSKAELLVSRFGAKGFDYIGSGKADVPVWAVASTSYVVRASQTVLSQLKALNVPIIELEQHAASAETWLKALRFHQYAKNVLVFVPLLTAHKFDLSSLASSARAFLSFSACASAVYLLNDLIDLKSDRSHPTKYLRALTSGAIPIAHGVAAIPILLLAALALALAVSLKFVFVLATYFALTNAYSFFLKRKMLIDVVALALLYTIRVIGGAVAIGVSVSEWLFVFSVFIFTSLALIKRYTELAVRLDAKLSDPHNRNYKVGDLDVVAALAAASGMNAVTIFAIYLASPAVTEHYRRPEILWLYCPLLLYWIARLLMIAHRRNLLDDPIVFALRDRISRYMVLLMLAITVVAI